MKLRIWWILLVVFIVLDWLALDDITTGHESDYWGEYLILFISGVFFTVFIRVWHRQKKT